MRVWGQSVSIDAAGRFKKIDLLESEMEKEWLAEPWRFSLNMGSIHSFLVWIQQ